MMFPQVRCRRHRGSGEESQVIVKSDVTELCETAFPADQSIRRCARAIPEPGKLLRDIASRVAFDREGATGVAAGNAGQ
jgi:hypothetical protein